MYPQIIYISGASSSGKTTLIRLLQEELEGNYLHLGIDQILKQLPEKVLLKDLPKYLSWKGEPLPALLYESLRAQVLQMAELGLGVILEDVCLSQEDFRKWSKLLAPYSKGFILLNPSLEELERRERSRQDHGPGWAALHLKSLYRGPGFDLEIGDEQFELEKIISTLAIL